MAVDDLASSDQNGDGQVASKVAPNATAASSARNPDNETSDGLHLEFKNVQFTVNVKGKPVEILKGVSGNCKSGRLLAIMGASGAGKTTLLDVLAYNVYAGTVRGEVLVNGQPRRRKPFTRTSCYVQQRDVLLASATVREAITTSALLKLPRTMTRAEKQQRVDDTLKELELEGCQHTLIGDETLGLKGISGGQKRRVSVGVELVKDPQLVFLDEPTSGLDSEMAVSLIVTLVQLARKGRTVACTIHQPNSDITRRFDDFLLLAAGRVVYFGPWTGAVGYFGDNGFSCPMYSNPTDYFMSVVRDPDNALKLASAYESYAEQQRRLLPAAEPLTAPKPSSEGRADAGKPSGDVEAGPDDKGGAQEKPQASVVNQMQVLAARFGRTWYRNPQMLASELVQYIFMALLTGLMYLQVSDDAEKGSYDRAASIWFSLAVLSFTPSYTAAVTWDRERLLLRRELSSGQYRPTSYFLAKTLVTFPFEAVQGALYVAISYWMIGLQADAGKFFFQVAVYLLFLMASETIGLLVSILARTATNSVVLLTLVLLLLLSFSGFLSAEVKPYFKWIQDFSYLTYAFTAAVQSEFTGLTLYDANGQPVDGATLIPSQLQNGISAGGNLAILAAQLVGYRLLAWVAMVGYAHFHWL